MTEQILEIHVLDEGRVILLYPSAPEVGEMADIPLINPPLPGVFDIRSSLDPDLPEEEKEKIAKLCLGLDLREIEDLFSRSLARHDRIDLQTIEILRAEVIKRKGDHLFTIEFPKENLDQIAFPR